MNCRILAFLFLTVASAGAAESIDVTLWRRHRFGPFTWDRPERYAIGLTSDRLAGVLSIDERTHLVVGKTEAIPLTPGVTAARHELDARKTGGQILISRSGGDLMFDLFYRRVVATQTKTGPETGGPFSSPVFAEIHREGRISPKQPVVIYDPTPEIRSISFTYRTN